MIKKKITKHIPFVAVVNNIDEVTECLLNISAKIQSIEGNLIFQEEVLTSALLFNILRIKKNILQ